MCFITIYNISRPKRKLHQAMELLYIFNQDHLLVAPPGSEKHCRLESFIIRTIQKRKTFPHFFVKCNINILYFYKNVNLVYIYQKKRVNIVN